MTEELEEYECKVCPTCGSCSGMYTANSMNCLTEVLGMGLQGNGTIPAVYSERLRLAKRAGMQVMELLKKNIRPRDIMTDKAFMNALTVDMALGCSTNSMLHLPAIAHEAGVELNVDIANEVSATHAEPLSSGTGRSYLYGGSERGRRCICSHERTDQKRICLISGLYDSYRKDGWREHCKQCKPQSGSDPSD